MVDLNYHPTHSHPKNHPQLGFSKYNLSLISSKSPIYPPLAEIFLSGVDQIVIRWTLYCISLFVRSVVYVLI